MQTFKWIPGDDNFLPCLGERLVDMGPHIMQLLEFDLAEKGEINGSAFMPS